jgi:glycosyl transferase family 2
VNDRPLVSIIIPNYNYAKTLGACLRAAFGQTYHPLEVVVVDDGSTDESVRIAEEFPCELLKTANRGVSAARNLGAGHSRGEILFFLDSDVELRPDAVAVAVELLDADPSLGAVCGIYDWVPLVDDGVVERYKVLHGHFWRVRSAGEVRLASFSLGAFRRGVFEAVGPLDENLRYTEDVEYGARLSTVSRIEMSTRVVGKHDDDDKLSVLLGKQFTRSMPLVALFVHRGPERPRLDDTAFRPTGVAAATIAAAAVPAAVVWPWLLPLPVLCLVTFVASERTLLGFVRGKAGTRFTSVFLVLHLLMNLTTGAAAGVGAVRWLVSGRFRRYYRQGERIATTSARGAVDV